MGHECVRRLTFEARIVASLIIHYRGLYHVRAEKAVFALELLAR